MKKYLLLFLLSVSMYATDCVPLTFTTLSKMSGYPVSYSEWHDKIMPDNVTAEWGVGIDAWNRRFMLMQLECIYPDNKASNPDDAVIKENTPYVWIGIAPAKYTNSEVSDGHCAIMYYDETQGFRILHTINDNGTHRYFMEYVSVDEFFRRTYFVYNIGHRIIIPWKIVEFTKLET